MVGLYRSWTHLFLSTLSRFVLFFLDSGFCFLNDIEKFEQSVESLNFFNKRNIFSIEIKRNSAGEIKCV